MDDGRGGYFASLVGLASPFLMPSLTVTSLTRSLTYRFRYRAINCYGNGPFSDELYVLAATVPSAPPAPKATSISSTSVTFTLYPTNDNGGSAVTNYELWRNLGTDGSAF